VNTAGQYAPGRAVIGLTRGGLELTDFAAVRGEFRRQQPGLVIHCAAMSRSPECQANPALARRVNVEATAHLADLAADIPFIFFSSDLVFDGEAGNYDEAAPVAPLSIYGETKAAAEQRVLANPRHTVIRTSLNCGESREGNRAFSEEWRLALAAGRTLRLFTDEYRSPIHARVTAQAVWELAAREEAGLFHLAGAERLSRWDMGRLLAERWGRWGPQLEPASRLEYPGARRPADTSLNCGKVQRRLSFRLPGLTAWLAANPDLGAG
jgi:dTDP-4-dehydrorhamnose reductase